MVLGTNYPNLATLEHALEHAMQLYFGGMPLLTSVVLVFLFWLIRCEFVESFTFYVCSFLFFFVSTLDSFSLSSNQDGRLDQDAWPCSRVRYCYHLSSLFHFSLHDLSLFKTMYTRGSEPETFDMIGLYTNISRWEDPSPSSAEWST